MDLIHKINRLDHPGVLREFSWPPDLFTFGRFNLIYGWDKARPLQLPDAGLLYQDLSEDYGPASEDLDKAKADIHAFVSDLIEHLERKRSHPFTRLELNVPVPDVDFAAVTRANDVIQSHNRRCDDFRSSVEAAGRRLADAMIAASVPEHARLEAEVANAQAPIHALDSEIRQLNDEVALLEQSIIEHRQPAEELNEDLHKYLGHDEIRVDVRDTGYMLTRGGVPALSLSEGERTALALLYFLKSLGDRSFDKAQGVLVLDDPVSSLDANSLYLASSFIRERTGDAGQLFLLTHNFTFFREIRNWFRHLPGQNARQSERRPAKFYMLESVPGTNPRRAVLRALDPLLENFESEYHYLFSCIYVETRNENGVDLERSYLLPNVARRLLEMFLAFRRPQANGHLWGKMGDIDFDSVKNPPSVRQRSFTWRDHWRTRA